MKTTISLSRKWMAAAIGEVGHFGTVVRIDPTLFPTSIQKELIHKHSGSDCDLIFLTVKYSRGYKKVYPTENPVPGVKVTIDRDEGRIGHIFIPANEFPKKMDEFLFWLDSLVKKANMNELRFRYELLYKIFVACRAELFCPAQ